MVVSDGEGEAVSPAEGGGADQAFALDAPEQRIEFHLQRDAGGVRATISEGDAGDLCEIVQRAVDEVYVFDVEADAAALQEIEEVGAGLLRDFPDGAGLDGDVACFLDVFEDGDGVAGQLQDAAELGEGAVQLLQWFAQRLDV